MRVCLALIMISFTGMDLLAKEKKQKKNDLEKQESKESDKIEIGEWAKILKVLLVPGGSYYLSVQQQYYFLF